MADFLINVRSTWDSASVRAYAEEVKKAIREIRAAASQAGPTPAVGGGAGSAGRQEYFQGEQARMEASLKGLRQSGVIPQAEYAALATTQRAALKAAADAAGVELLSGRARAAAANQVLAQSRVAQAAEAAANDAKIKGAREAARNATRRTREPGEAAYERRKADTAGTRRAALEEHGLPVVEGELAQNTRQRIREAERIAAIEANLRWEQAISANLRGLNDALTETRRLEVRRKVITAAIVQADIQRLRLSQSWAQGAAAERVSRTDLRGRAAAEITARPDYVASQGTAARREGTLRARTQSVEARQVLVSQQDLQARIDAYNDRRRMQQAIRLQALAEETTTAAADAARRAAQRQAQALAERARRSSDQATERAVEQAGKAIETSLNAQARSRQRAAEAAKREADAAERQARRQAESEAFLADNARRRQRAEAEANRRRSTQTAAVASDREVNAAVNRAARFYEQSFNEQARSRKRAADAVAKEAAAAEAAARKAAEHATALQRPASYYQRLQRDIHRRTGQEDRPADTFPTIRQSVGQGVLSAARFGIGAGLLYGGLNTVKEMVTEASELERVFGQIESQFQETGKAADFGNFRREIIDISKETGQMATEVAFVGFQFQGAFGDGPGGAAYALEQTRSAIEIARVTGLNLNELVDSLTASSIAFGVGISDVGDKALGIQERFGVQAKETLQFFGDLSTVAGEAGLSLEQLGAIAGVAQQATGRSGTALAEGLARIIPGIQDASTQIIRFYQQTPALQAKVPDLARAAGQGNTGAILDRLIRDYETLDEVQKKQIITLLGGRREAQVLIPILQNSAKYVKELGAAHDDTGKQQQYFADLQRTLAQRMAELGREFEALGQKIFESGLGDFLKDLATAAGVVVEVLSILAGAFGEMNSATHGAALRVIELIALLKGLRALGLLGTVGACGFRANQGIRSIGAQAGSEAALLAAQGRLGAGRAAFRSARAAGGGRWAGANAGLAGAGITPLGLGAITAGVIGMEYLDQRGKVQDAEKKLVEQLKKADSQQLDAIAKSKTDFWTKVAIRASGAELPEELARKQQRINASAQAAEQFTAANEAGLLKQFESAGLDPKTISEVLEARAKGDEDAIALINKVLDKIRGAPGGATQLGEAVSTRAKNLTAKEATDRVDSGQVIQSMDEAEQAYRAGAISASDYISNLDRELESFRTILRSSGKLTEDQAKKFAEAQRKQAKAYADETRSLDDYNLEVAELGGGGGPAATVETLTARLQDPKFTDPEARQKAARDIIAAQQAVLQQRVAMEDDVEKQLAIMEAGVEIPDEARVALLQAQITTLGSSWQAFVQAIAGTMEGANELGLRIAQMAIDNNISLVEAAKRVLTADLAKATELMNRFAQPGMDESSFTTYQTAVFNLQAALDKLNTPGALPTVNVPGGKGKPSPEDAAAKRREVAKKREADAKEAERLAEENARARFNLQRAEAAGDPVRLAQIAIDEARFLKASAKTTADSLNAQAQLVDAQRALGDAQLQVGDAYRNIDRALAEAAGDTVRVAQIEIDQARSHLESARARGDLLGGLQAEAELITAQSNAVRAQIDKGTSDIDFMMQMEQITTGQAIAQLEALLQIPGITQEQTRSLLLKIKQLRSDASADIAFNIPSEIKLPTLYEVRRANQTAAAGQSYQDARVITINFTANNTADAQGIANEIVDRFSGPSRFGALPRRY
jgi:hypothetical protein